MMSRVEVAECAFYIQHLHSTFLSLITLSVDTHLAYLNARRSIRPQGGNLESVVARSLPQQSVVRGIQARILDVATCLVIDRSQVQ